MPETKMRIAINAADLDHARIDGTRIYIWNLLKNFGSLDKEDQFLIYHRSRFNPEIKCPKFENYQIKKIKAPFWWTQTGFALEMLRIKPEVLWMPMHSLPYFRSKKTKTVITIHDLAFKFFPDHFPKKDLWRLNWFTDFAVKNADKLIAISHSTKNDLLKLYPGLREEKIKVIHHGYDKELFNERVVSEEIKKINTLYKIPDTKYIICAGALQPRKNIETLLDAFLILRKENFRDLQLVVAGDLGWLYGSVMKKIKSADGVVYAGKYKTKDLPALLRGAESFVMPSLYEGFGLPVLEAMACGTPVIAAENSSLPEIVRGFGILYKPNNATELAKVLREVLGSAKLRGELREKGLQRVKQFSWEKCAEATLDWLKS